MVVRALNKSRKSQFNLPDGVEGWLQTFWWHTSEKSEENSYNKMPLYYTHCIII